MTAPSPKPAEIAKPCPFCGSPAKHRNNEFGDWYECSNRTGFGEGCAARKLCMTLEEWNKRAPALAPFEKLIPELRAKAEENKSQSTYFVGWGDACDYLADRLSAVVEEVRGK